MSYSYSIERSCAASLEWKKGALEFITNFMLIHLIFGLFICCEGSILHFKAYASFWIIIDSRVDLNTVLVFIDFIIQDFLLGFFRLFFHVNSY